MANFPVQVILDSDRYIQEVLPHPGGSRKDFYSGKNELFSSHKEKITTQLDSVSVTFSENQYSSIGYTKVRLITNAWAKSHRPLGKIFTTNNGCTMVGGLRQGEMLVRLSAESASLIKNGIIEHAEDEPRRSPNKEGILMDRPSEWRCEVGTIDSIIPYGAEDKLKINLEDIHSWIEKYGTCQFLIELFDKPIPQQNWDTLMEEEYKLHSSFINGLKTHTGLCIYRSKILSSDTKFILLLTDKEDVTVSLFDSIQHNSTAEVTHDIEKYVSLLEFISGHPIVKSIDIVPIVESNPIPSFNIDGTEELIIPQPSSESDYPTIAVVDTGISAIYAPWIIDDWDNISVNMRDTTHGTFITGLLVNGQLLNSSSVCQDPDGCKIIDLCMLPKKDKFSSVYPNSLDDFLGELNVAIPTILSRTDVRIFNLSMNIRCTRLSSDYGEFAKALDELAVKYNIVFVISAGNLMTSRPEWSDNPIDNITEWNKRDDDIVYMPAESCRNISVGALNPTNNGLTSYSCRGKGSTLTVKPDFVHIGGLGYIDPEIGTGLYSVDNNSNITYNCGTSFSAPLVAKTMALVEKQIEGTVSRETLIALMVQNSHIPSAFNRPEYQTMLKDLIGYGIPTSAHKILNGDQHSINLVFASRIKPKKEMVFEFMWPQCLIRNNKCYGDVKITLVSTPAIDYNYGDEMIRGNLNVTLSQTKGDGTSQYYLKPLYKEEAVREHGEYEWQLINENMKWQPIKVYHKEFKRGTTHYSPWKLRVSREDRDFNVVDNEGIPFTIIMTISDTSLETNVYDEIRQTLVAQGVQIADIQTAARITQRI